jgi:hypothetical protein
MPFTPGPSKATAKAAAEEADELPAADQAAAEPSSSSAASCKQSNILQAPTATIADLAEVTAANLLLQDKPAAAARALAVRAAAENSGQAAGIALHAAARVAALAAPHKVKIVCFISFALLLRGHTCCVCYVASSVWYEYTPQKHMLSCRLFGSIAYVAVAALHFSLTDKAPACAAHPAARSVSMTHCCSCLA